MTTFEFYPPAEQEYLDAARHFDEQGEGLGDYFMRDIEAAILKIRENPLTWRKMSRLARRYLTNNFPYQVTRAMRPTSSTPTTTPAVSSSARSRISGRRVGCAVVRGTTASTTCVRFWKNRA